jgi:hypothetical protein
MTERTCSVTGCVIPWKRGDYCYGHYMKNWRYGTPTPERAPAWDDIRGRRFGTLIVVRREGMRWLCACDCGRERTASAGELNREGEANTCGDRPTHRRAEAAGYSAAHGRVRRDRGPVQNLACVECGSPARHWSYNHDDPNEMVQHGLSVRPVAYSLDPQHYSPRCVPCHKLFDIHRDDAMPSAR